MILKNSMDPIKSRCEVPNGITQGWVWPILFKKPSNLEKVLIQPIFSNPLITSVDGQPLNVKYTNMIQ
jgi:hypothetical protein